MVSVLLIQVDNSELHQSNSLTTQHRRLRDSVPGEIAMVTPRKQWTCAGHPYLSGEIESSHLDIDALGLVPLRLEKRGLWTPEEHCWGDADEPPVQ